MINEMFAPTPLLGQAGSLAPLAVDWSLGIPWWGWSLIFAAIMAAFVALVCFRKMAFEEPESSTNANLARLDQARADGLLTRDEYRRARRALLADMMGEESPADDETTDDPPADDAGHEPADEDNDD